MWGVRCFALGASDLSVLKICWYFSEIRINFVCKIFSLGLCGGYF